MLFCCLDLVCAIGGRQRVCIPKNYQKYDLPHPTKPTFVTIGVDIKELLTIISPVVVVYKSNPNRNMRLSYPLDRTFPRYLTRTSASLSMLISTLNGATLDY